MCVLLKTNWLTGEGSDIKFKAEKFSLALSCYWGWFIIVQPTKWKLINSIRTSDRINHIQWATDGSPHRIGGCSPRNVWWNFRIKSNELSEHRRGEWPVICDIQGRCYEEEEESSSPADVIDWFDYGMMRVGAWNGLLPSCGKFD